MTAGPLLSTKGRGERVGFFATMQQVSSPRAATSVPSFNITNFTASVLVGKYVDATGSGNFSGITLCTRGTLLIAGYSFTRNIGVWTINPDCSLTLANPAANTSALEEINSLCISPDMKTLIVIYGQTLPGIDAFAISGETLVRVGAYDTTGSMAGIDFSPDSQYVILGDFSSSNTFIELFPSTPMVPSRLHLRASA